VSSRQKARDAFGLSRMNESIAPEPNKPNPWNRLNRYLRGGIIFVIGALIGGALASPDSAKVDQANAIAAKQKSIYADAYSKRDEAEQRVDELNDQAAEARVQQRTAEKKLATLRRKVRGARSTIAKSSFPGEGTFRVGKEVEPGTYKAAGSSGCYWARLGSGDTSDIIDNNNADGPVLLTIEPGDFAIEVARCATFHKQ
jgi:hypothetical protein